MIDKLIARYSVLFKHINDIPSGPAFKSACAELMSLAKQINRIDRRFDWWARVWEPMGLTKVPLDKQHPVGTYQPEGFTAPEGNQVAASSAPVVEFGNAAAIDFYRKKAKRK